MVLKFTRNEVDIRSADQLRQMIKEARQEGALVYVEALITPATAALFLETNECNRPVSDFLVEAYERDIRANKWEFNGDSLRFDREGRMVEGQHRCLAIVRAGKPIKTLICFNASWVNVNAGVAESASSKLRGQKYRSIVAAVARLLEMRTLGKDIFDKDFRLTPTEVLRYSRDAGDDLVDAAASVAPMGTHGMSRNAIYGWIYLVAAEHLGFEAVRRFFHQLASGEEAHPLIARLRTRLIADASRMSRSTPLNLREKAYLVTRTIEAVATREKLERLQVPRDLEITTDVLVDMLKRAGKKAR